MNTGNYLGEKATKSYLNLNNSCSLYFVRGTIKRKQAFKRTASYFSPYYAWIFYLKYIKEINKTLSCE